jgi:hypothetical protein
MSCKCTCDEDKDTGIDGVSYKTLFENACMEIARFLNEVEVGLEDETSAPPDLSELDAEGLINVLHWSHWQEIETIKHRWVKGGYRSDSGII